MVRIKMSYKQLIEHLKDEKFASPLCQQVINSFMDEETMESSDDLEDKFEELMK